MSAIRVSGRCVISAEKGKVFLLSTEYLDEEGLSCRQIKKLQSESDFTNGILSRISRDNGRTWSEWFAAEEKEQSKFFGEDELGYFAETDEVWNPVHGHFVNTYMTRFYPGGHREAYRKYWEEGKPGYFDHVRIILRESGEETPFSDTPVFYEDGADFDPNDPGNPYFLQRNIGYANPVTVLKNGDIITPVGIPVEEACRIAGVDVDKVFPSCPKIHHGVLAARGRYDAEAKAYRFRFSEPVILGDLRSSRGIDEPVIAELESGRLLMIMRGSNVRSEGWNTRIQPGTPSFKWYAWSDDGGKTFTQPEPWHFDDREVIYSCASISRFIRSYKNGKLYWIGNITDHRAYGNTPRYPLQIVQVDETTGLAVKDTLTVIDTRREGESAELQLSNFSLLEDRVTGAIRLTLAKLGQFDEAVPFWGETWEYEILVE